MFPSAPWPKRKTWTREPVDPASTMTAKTSSLAVGLWWPSMGASAPASEGWAPRASAAAELRWWWGCCCCWFGEVENGAACEETSGKEGGCERANSAPRTRSWAVWVWCFFEGGGEEVGHRAPRLFLSKTKKGEKTRWKWRVQRPLQSFSNSSDPCPHKQMPVQCGPRNRKPFQRAEGSGNGEREKLRAIRRALTANRATSLSFPLAFSRVLKPPLPFSYRGRDRQHGIPLPSGETRPERARAAPGRRAIHRTRQRRRRSRRRRRCCCSRCRDGAGPVRGGELFSGRGGGGCGPARPQTCCAAGGARGQREGKRERGRIR